jgi:hypothetical protein
MGVVVRTGPRVANQPHVIRKPTSPVVADAIPEPIEPRPTARLDMTRLDGLIDTSRDKPAVDQDVLEIAVEVAEALAPSRGSSTRLAHTLRRDTPPAGVKPSKPMPVAPAKLAQGSVPDFPVYRPEAVPQVQEDRRVTARIAPVEVVEATPTCVTSRMQQITSIDIPMEEDTSAPIDAVIAAPVATFVRPTVRPVSGRVLGIVLMLVLLTGSAITAAALFLY